MAGNPRLFAGAGSPHLATLLQNQRVLPSSSSDAFFLSGASPFLGSRGMVSFEDVHGGTGSTTTSFFRPFDHDDDGDDDADEFFHRAEKKRRLTANQVQSLEKSFEEENKLEPERKVQLAKDLGLQPRQVAIWFQNRRARWKTKQMEKDYDALQSSYDSLKAQFEILIKERDELKSEVLLLKDKLLRKDKGGTANPELPDMIAGEPTDPAEPVLAFSSDGELSDVPISTSKPEDICSVKSGNKFDPESPHFTDQWSLLEPGDSSYGFEPEQSDLSSQDEEETFPFPSRNFPNMYPNKLGFRVGDQDHAFWSWSY